MTFTGEDYYTAPEWYESYRGFIHRSADKIRLTNHPIITLIMAEMLATAILIFYGDGAVAQKFFMGTDFHDISLGWGAAATVAILIAGGKASPAIMNPAIAVSNTVSGRLKWFLLPIFIVVEVVGALIGATVLLAVINTKLVNYVNTVDHGVFLVNTTGGIFVAGKGASLAAACLDQVVTTALLVWCIMAVGDDLLVKKPGSAVPLLVGMVVYMAVDDYTVNASSALNPARDLGPRILLLITHWGVDAFTIDNYYFWVPTLIPVVGAVLGAFIYEFVVGIHVPSAGGFSVENQQKAELESIWKVSTEDHSFAFDDEDISLPDIL